MTAAAPDGSAAETAWSLVQYSQPEQSFGDRPRLGIGLAGTVHLPPPSLAHLTLMEVLEAWDEHVDLLRGLTADAVRGAVAVRDAVVVAPLTYPRKVLCAGANYYDHAAEMGTARPDPSAEPFFFLKTPTTTIVGPDARIPLPGRASTQLDWEAELAVVVSRRAKDITPAQAADHIAGYVVANDLSDRGSFPRPNAVFPPFAWDWLAHKSPDGSCPIGPGLVPSWLVEDPQTLDIGLSVNGEVKQASNTADMVVGVSGLLAAASRLMTLEPGDLVLTGTPAGVGMPRQTFLSSGDVVTVTIERIGSITHTICSPTTSEDQP